MWFEIGEIAILKCDTSDTSDEIMRFNGEECTVLDGPGEFLTDMDTVVNGYSVVTTGGRELICRPHELKKRPSNGDRNTVVSWDSCAWQPKVTA